MRPLYSLQKLAQMANPNPSKPFRKNDPRINKLGRPKTFDAARELAQAIAAEVAKQGDTEIVINGHRVTIIEAIMRQWATSKVPALQQAFVEYAIGKPPIRTEISGPSGGPIQTRTKMEHEIDPEYFARVFRILGEADANPGALEASALAEAASPE